MHQLFELTQKIHAKVQEKAAKYEKEAEMKGAWFTHPQKGLFLATEKMDVMNKELWDKFLSECQIALQEKQIKQILLAFDQELSDSNRTKFPYQYCQKWLDGLNPLFDQTETDADGNIIPVGQIQVLTELLEFLESI